MKIVRGSKISSLFDCIKANRIADSRIYFPPTWFLGLPAPFSMKSLYSFLFCVFILLGRPKYKAAMMMEEKQHNIRSIYEFRLGGWSEEKSISYKLEILIVD